MKIEDISCGLYAIESETGSIKRFRIVGIDVPAGKVSLEYPSGGAPRWENRVSADRVLRPWKEHTARKRELPDAVSALRDALTEVGMDDASVFARTAQAAVSVQLSPQDAHKLAMLIVTSKGDDSSALERLFVP